MTLVPAAHEPLEQQPPLQGCTGEQAIVQKCVEALHAWPGGQSAATLQPQPPFTQAVASAIEQFMHCEPAGPQALELEPAAHFPPAQQAPLQGTVGLQPLWQKCTLGSQAVPGGQSFDV
jgi:hypothetical protein